MRERISTIRVRQHIGDLLNRVALRHDEFIIERKGKALAALVPVERLEQMRRTARQRALAFLDAPRKVRLSEADAKALALRAVRWARRRKPRRRRAKP